MKLVTTSHKYHEIQKEDSSIPAFLIPCLWPVCRSVTRAIRVATKLNIPTAYRKGAANSGILDSMTIGGWAKLLMPTDQEMSASALELPNLCRASILAPSLSTAT